MSSFMKVACHVFLVMVLFPAAESCTFPSDLTGKWVTSSRSMLTFTSTTFTPWTVTSQGTFTFTCLLQNGSKYISKSDSFSYIGLTWHAYLCMDLNAINTDGNAYYYYLASSQQAEAGNDQVRIFTSGTVITESLICDSTNYQIGTYEVMVKNGTAAQVASTCPKAIQAYWKYTYNTGSGNTCPSGSYFDACGDYKQATFNYTYCSTKVAYSALGVLYCIYSTTSGTSTYLTLYNTDTTTDESSTYRYTCMVLSTSSNSVYLTQYPNKCLSNQTSTSVISPGATIVFQNATSCVPSTQVSAAGLAVGLILAFLIIIVLVVLLVWYLWKKKKRDEKTRGDKDLETAAEEKSRELEKEDESDEDDDDEKKEKDKVAVNGDKPPDVLFNVVETPVSFLAENCRPTTSGSVHVTLEAGYEGDTERKSDELLIEELPIQMTSYSVVGVHPAFEDDQQDSAPPDGGSTPVQVLVPQKAIVPKEAVALANGDKPQKLKANNRRIKPATVESNKLLAPIVEDASPRKSLSPTKGTTPRGSHPSFRRTFGARATVGVEETNAEDYVDAKTLGKLKGGRTPRGKKPLHEKSDKKIRNRTSRDVKEVAQDDEEYAPPLTPIKITRVDINDLTRDETPRKSPRSRSTDLRVVCMDDDVEKIVPEGATLEENPEYPFTSPRRKSWLQEEIPEDHTEVWSKVSNLWKLGQVWMDKGNV